jgi:FlaA1/EpsC-like NDP-sugar epimerase
VRAGHELVAFADVDPRKVGQEIYGVPVVNPETLDAYRECYLLSAVGSDEGRSNVRADLEARGFHELIDYCAVA